MKRSGLRRWFGLLGIVAFLGAVVEMPVASTAAVAMTAKAKGSTASHQPAKPCKHCPNKLPVDMGACLLKCFPAFYAPAANPTLKVSFVVSRASPPSPSRPVSGTSYPPPLRPPNA